MIFNISDKDLLDPNKIKIFNGIAGSGKSTSTVNELNKLGSNFCLASFSNALKFAAADKFGCNVETICGLEFINTPYPRYEEKIVEDFDTVVNDEILLDGIECIKWMEHNVGNINIIALTDSRQMLNAENSDAVIKAFNKLCKRKDVIYVEISETKRARDEETRETYNKLFNMNSNQLLTVNQVKKLFNCDIININDINFNTDNTYICHSNMIEHEIYKRYKISDRRDIDLIPKNHISRKKKVDINKYPICDQITAVDKRIDSYLQAANIATPTRFQGKEVEVGKECYFIVQKDSIFTGREVYTVCTRCQSIKSLHIVIIDIDYYEDPKTINGKVVSEAKHLNINKDDKTYKYTSPSKIADIIKNNGEQNVAYYYDYITSGEYIVYSSLSNSQLSKFADINEDGTVKFKHTKGGAKRTIKSITKKDTSMHFDYMPKVYSIIDMEVTPPRIHNPSTSNKKQFSKLCDIYSAFPTVLNNAELPKAGLLYYEYDENLLNFYIYEGDTVTKGSLITEELADKLGNSKYVFSTDIQKGCELGRYTYKQCKESKEAKSKINKEFLWGVLESGYYIRQSLIVNGELTTRYVKNSTNNLELVACALWSKLCVIMLDAISSINASDFFVITDGLYYNGDKIPSIPEWCDYRIEAQHWKKKEKDTDEKYTDVIYKTYKDLPTAEEAKKKKKREDMRKKRAALSYEEKEEILARRREAYKNNKK